MSAPTVAVHRAIAQAGDKGLAHLARQQNTGTWLSDCGRQIRGEQIHVVDGDQAGAHAEQLGDRFCAACRDDAIAVAGATAAGVDVLLRRGGEGASTVVLVDVPLAAIGLDPDRPQRPADPGLVHSVREHGVVQPLVLRRTSTGLVLVAGGRRLAAASLADLDTVPALVRDATVNEALMAGLVENLHRTDLNPIEEAHGYQRALAQLDLTTTALADRLGVSRSQVANTIRLLGLPPHLQDQVAAGVLSAAHGRDLLRVTDPDEQDALADRIREEGMSTRESGAAVRRILAGAPADPQLAGVAELLAGLLTAQVKVTSRGEGSRIVIDVPGEDLARVLERLGARVAAD